jgi:hypothetical protein
MQVSRLHYAISTPSIGASAMPIELGWVTKMSPSCFHAVDALFRELPLADERLAEGLAEPVDNLRMHLEGLGVAPTAFLAHVVPLSAGIESNRELASLALTKTIGRQEAASRVDRIAGLFTSLEAAFHAAQPRLEDELALRAQPLRQQWEARGPGLMAGITRLTESDFVVSRADVLLLHPAMGGSGYAHLPYNSVRIEGVLAHPWPQLPEIVRLGWLLSQLNLDLPKYQGGLTRGRLEAVGYLAMIPVTLEAAAEVELTKSDQPMLRFALQAWGAVPGPEPDYAEPLWDWWQVQRESRMPWVVALAALDRMLSTQDAAELNGSQT